MVSESRGLIYSRFHFHSAERRSPVGGPVLQARTKIRRGPSSHTFRIAVILTAARGFLCALIVLMSLALWMPGLRGQAISYEGLNVARIELAAHPEIHLD